MIPFSFMISRKVEEFLLRRLKTPFSVISSSTVSFAFDLEDFGDGSIVGGMRIAGKEGVGARFPFGAGTLL